MEWVMEGVARCVFLRPIKPCRPGPTYHRVAAPRDCPSEPTMSPTQQKTRTTVDVAKLQKLLDPVPEATTGGGGGGGSNDGGGGDPPPPPEGDDGVSNENRPFNRAIAAGGAALAMLATRSCSWRVDESSASLFEYVGRWGYVAIIGLCILYLLVQLVSAPLKPDWFTHGQFAEKAKASLIIVLAISTVQAAVSDWNRSEGTALALPNAMYASFVPLFLFSTYYVLIVFFSPIKRSPDGVPYCVGEPTSQPVVRYALTMLFMAACLLSVLLAAHRIAEVFIAMPSDWYKPFVPWLWFR